MALMGCFSSLTGLFPTLIGRFADFVLRGRFTSWKFTGKQLIKKALRKGALREDFNASMEIATAVRVTAKRLREQKLSHCNFCLKTSRCLFSPTEQGKQRLDSTPCAGKQKNYFEMVGFNA